MDGVRKPLRAAGEPLELGPSYVGGGCTAGVFADAARSVGGGSVFAVSDVVETAMVDVWYESGPTKHGYRDIEHALRNLHIPHCLDALYSFPSTQQHAKKMSADQLREVCPAKTRTTN